MSMWRVLWGVLALLVSIQLATSASLSKDGLRPSDLFKSGARVMLIGLPTKHLNSQYGHILSESTRGPSRYIIKLDDGTRVSVDRNNLVLRNVEGSTEMLQAEAGGIAYNAHPGGRVVPHVQSILSTPETNQAKPAAPKTEKDLALKQKLTLEAMMVPHNDQAADSAPQYAHVPVPVIQTQVASPSEEVPTKVEEKPVEATEKPVQVVEKPVEAVEKPAVAVETTAEKSVSEDTAIEKPVVEKLAAENSVASITTTEKVAQIVPAPVEKQAEASATGKVVVDNTVTNNAVAQVTANDKAVEQVTDKAEVTDKAADAKVIVAEIAEKKEQIISLAENVAEKPTPVEKTIDTKKNINLVASTTFLEGSTISASTVRQLNPGTVLTLNNVPGVPSDYPVLLVDMPDQQRSTITVAYGNPVSLAEVPISSVRLFVDEKYDERTQAAISELLAPRESYMLRSPGDISPGPGESVTLKNLELSEFNGKSAVVTSWMNHHNNRFNVIVDGETLAVKVDNVIYDRVVADKEQAFVIGSTDERVEGKIVSVVKSLNPKEVEVSIENNGASDFVAIPLHNVYPLRSKSPEKKDSPVDVQLSLFSTPVVSAPKNHQFKKPHLLNMLAMHAPQPQPQPQPKAEAQAPQSAAPADVPLVPVKVKHAAHAADPSSAPLDIPKSQDSAKDAGQMMMIAMGEPETLTIPVGSKVVVESIPTLPFNNQEGEIVGHSNGHYVVQFQSAHKVGILPKYVKLLSTEERASAKAPKPQVNNAQSKKDSPFLVMVDGKSVDLTMMTEEQLVSALDYVRSAKKLGTKVEADLLTMKVAPEETAPSCNNTAVTQKDATVLPAIQAGSEETGPSCNGSAVKTSSDSAAVKTSGETAPAIASEVNTASTPIASIDKVSFLQLSAEVQFEIMSKKATPGSEVTLKTGHKAKVERTVNKQFIVRLDSKEKKVVHPRDIEVE